MFDDSFDKVLGQLNLNSTQRELIKKLVESNNIKRETLDLIDKQRKEFRNSMKKFGKAIENYLKGVKFYGFSSSGKYDLERWANKNRKELIKIVKKGGYSNLTTIENSRSLFIWKKEILNLKGYYYSKYGKKLFEAENKKSETYFPGITEFILGNHYKFSVIYRGLEEIKSKVTDKEITDIIIKEQEILKKTYGEYRIKLKRFLDILSKNPEEFKDIANNDFWMEVTDSTFSVGVLGTVLGVVATLLAGFVLGGTFLTSAIITSIFFVMGIMGYISINASFSYLNIKNKIEKAIEKSQKML